MEQPEYGKNEVKSLCTIFGSSNLINLLFFLCFVAKAASNYLPKIDGALLATYQ